jgi:hypothetical protein
MSYTLSVGSPVPYILEPRAAGLPRARPHPPWSTFTRNQDDIGHGSLSFDPQIFSRTAGRVFRDPGGY